MQRRSAETCPVGWEVSNRLRKPLTVVLRPLRNNHHIPRLDLLLLSRDDSFADSRSEDKMLVDGVDLELGRAAAHKHEFIGHL